MKRISVLLFFLLSIACTRTIYTPVYSEKVVIDTVVREVQDSSVVKALLECDSSGRVLISTIDHLHGELANSKVVIDTTGKVEVITKWRTKYIERIKEVHDTTTVVEIREVDKIVKVIPRFFWWCFGIALTSVLGGAFWVYRKIKKW